jgi:hypothetical protein
MENTKTQTHTINVELKNTKYQYYAMRVETPQEYKKAKKLLLDVRLSSNGLCLVPMISPLGLIVESLLKAQGVTVIRLLHDFEKHPGDKWPPGFLIRNLIKRSDFLIALSNEVARKIKSKNPKINPTLNIIKLYPKYSVIIKKCR